MAIAVKRMGRLASNWTAPFPRFGLQRALSIVAVAAATGLAGIAPAGAQQLENRGEVFQAARGIFSGFFNRGEAAGFNATREQLAEAGITGPLMLGVLQGKRGELSAGYLKAGNLRELDVWRALDSATFMTDPSGVLRATVGLGIDLYGAETDQVAAALNGTGPSSYSR
ncbi:MAG: hypothetical protein AAGF13_05355, partial [Pseudomonadota bacterium]